jgi:uncharacterized membrane protein
VLKGQRRERWVDLYTIVKYVHVVLAIVAIGFNATYGIWLNRAAKEPEHMAWALRGIKILDDRFANPAYALLLVTGFVMVFAGDIPLTTFWISTALGIYVVLVLVAILVFTPTLKKQIALAEGGRADSEEFGQLGKRAGMTGGLLAVMVLVIEFLMVTKPTL